MGIFSRGNLAAIERAQSGGIIPLDDASMATLVAEQSEQISKLVKRANDLETVNLRQKIAHLEVGDVVQLNADIEGHIFFGPHTECLAYLGFNKGRGMVELAYCDEEGTLTGGLWALPLKRFTELLVE